MIIHGRDYDVCWTGVNDGHDGDFVCIPEEDKIHEKLRAPKVAPELDVSRFARPRRTAEETVALVAARLKYSDASQDQLERSCHCSRDAILKALQALRTAGVLKRTIGGGLNRPRATYSLSKDAA